MNTKLVNSAAGVINAALAQCRTAAGVALALESAQLLMSPETAAELERLRARVAELEAGLPVMQTALFKALDRVTELEAEPAMVCRVCEAPVRWVETQLSDGGWWNHTAPAADGHGVTPKPAPGRVSYAEKAARERHPGKRAAWLQLAQCEESDRVGEALLAQPEESPAETPAVTVFRASHDSIVMGHYTTRQAAYEHCEAHELREDSASPMSWNVDEDDGVAELVRFRVPGVESATGYEVTPVEIASEYDAEADE